MNEINRPGIVVSENELQSVYGGASLFDDVVSGMAYSLEFSIMSPETFPLNLALGAMGGVINYYSNY